MNQTYVENLKRPNNDQEEIYKDPKELISHKVFSKDILTYAIENFLESAEAYYDDYDPNKLYYKVYLANKTRNLCFDVENLPHLLGIPNHKYLIQASIINKLVREKTTSSNWLEVFKSTLETYKEDIINYDSNPYNINENKLNWDKVAEKVFAFLNLGILSIGDTYCFRHNVSINKVQDYVMTRDLISKEINGRIKIQFTIEKNGTEEYLVPTSIQYEENYNRGPIVMNEKKYIFDSKLTIEQKQGGHYGKK